ncbi:MAG: pyrroloquinoline quinone biosynthesis peptide chaperone PqqD [Gammaproteobacteria bacterium]|nr:MAG: pyrroloquinoline quinone biosynthesis peptide chaperone PqqD [Gammaproteobacteria bacterium]PCJ16293.1 MAG: pyrroloquinoline quinone biosynthesis peptide chaperone PqqD [Gammaproteobacteria bacterium]
MNTAIKFRNAYVLNSGFRLQWEKAQDSYVLLYPEGMVQLSFSASEVLLLCDGKNTAAEVITVLEEKFPDAEGLAVDVKEFLQEAIDNGWLE